ncbi:MAG: PAS domain S-box protein [Deltaproteobacteria bacterium]|nr:PAS domain S-box protein [Deltaproteobacteria bacterium]
MSQNANKPTAEDLGANDLHKNIVDSLGDMLLVLDLDGTIRNVNRWVIEKLNFTEEELVGKKAYELGEKTEARFKAADPVDRAFAMLPENDQENFRTKDGATIPVLVSHSVYRNNSGKIVGVVWLVRDISELKAAHDELDAKIRELEIQNIKIKEAAAQMVQMDKLSAVGELTAGVAHELNQPLNGIKLISQGLMRDLEKKRFQEAALNEELVGIIKQVDKMAQIINHMRVFSRKSDGPITEWMSLNEPIEGVFKLFGRQIESHGIEVSLELHPELPKVRGDAIRIEQVMLNLVGNARNALETSKTPGAKISIKTLPSADGKHVEAWVADNGPGIPEEIQEKIFQAFFTTKEAGKGTGLGLSISKKIIEEHGGKITVESKLGEGTTFKVVLPMDEKSMKGSQS